MLVGVLTCAGFQMKQILQNLGSGETLLVDVPCPRVHGGGYLIETTRSLVSLGTEKMLIDFGKANLLAKARQQPERVKEVLQKVKTDGFRSTMEAVKAKLDQPIPLGYSNVGVVVERGEQLGLKGVRVGDRVVSNGPHAEMVCVPANLCARVPDEVSDEWAAFTVVGAIGLQGIRLLQPTLGERVVVMGLGLIGLLCVQMLRAQGCRVLGTDFDERKLELARQFGAETVNLGAGEDPVEVGESWTGGEGVDGVLITAATKSDEPVHQAATMCRARGRIVLVGVVGLQLKRSDFYEKELSFQVSCSYGPGRYDSNYEEKGFDYPIGQVRWTEQRNFEAILQLFAEGKVDVSSLITHRASFEDALAAYQRVSDGGELGVMLDYGVPSIGRGTEEQGRSGKLARVVELRERSGRSRGPVVAFVGAGNFTTRILLPALSGEGCRLKSIVSNSGVTGTQAAEKFGFEQSLSESAPVFQDDEVEAVFITTPHHTHASLVQEALRSGKDVFVEKPLCLTATELEEIRLEVESGNARLMVGFNRRFSPHVLKMRELLSGVREPKSIVITVNAGAVDPGHWTQDPEVGGGRVLGEACHFVDLARCLADSPIVACSADFLGGQAGRMGDSLVVTITFEDGSIGAINYLSRGHRGFPKERVEVFAGEKVLQCDNFRRTRGYGWKQFKGLRTRRQDKGHGEELRRFLASMREGGQCPIPWEELHEVSKWTLDIWSQRSARHEDGSRAS